MHGRPQASDFRPQLGGLGPRTSGLSGEALGPGLSVGSLARSGDGGESFAGDPAIAEELTVPVVEGALVTTGDAASGNFKYISAVAVGTVVYFAPYTQNNVGVLATATILSPLPYYSTTNHFTTLPPRKKSIHPFFFSLTIL